jgi:hypothetical protein
LLEDHGGPSGRRGAPQREATDGADGGAVADLLEREAQPSAVDALLGRHERDEQREERHRAPIVEATLDVHALADLERKTSASSATTSTTSRGSGPACAAAPKFRTPIQPATRLR